MSHGDSLSQWDEAGLFENQSILLRLFQEYGMQVTIVSFGGREEYDLAPKLPGMRILCNWMGLPANTYARRLHQVHAPQLLGTHIVRTADAAAIVASLRIAWAWQIPLVYRFGFMLSDVRRQTFPAETEYISRLEGMEIKGLKGAALVFPPTDDIADRMAHMVPDAASKMTVIPNFVDVDNFRPLAKEKQYDLVYVGRLSIVKNLGALLEAVEKLELTIAVIGGPLPREVGTQYDESIELKARFGDLNGRIHWLGRIEHEDLPAYINQAKTFVMCSLSEGPARALIEAMACGLPCIGPNIPGIQSVIQHEVTGYLCDTDAESIALQL